MIKLDAFGRKEIVELPPGDTASLLIPKDWLLDSSQDLIRQVESLIIARAYELGYDLQAESSMETEGLIISWSPVVG